MASKVLWKNIIVLFTLLYNTCSRKKNSKRMRKLRNIGNQAREAGFNFKALSCTSFGFWDPVAEREIVKLCRAKSSRLGMTSGKVVASEFRLLSCAIMRGMASMILNRDIYCDYINDDQSLDD